MSFGTILVGVDLSRSSDAAVRQAMSLARKCGARVVLAHVPQKYADDRVKLEPLRQQLAGQGVEISTAIMEDDEPDRALADAAKRFGADLIAVGTHGRTGLRRLLLGSIAEKTVRFAATSVLVARGDGAPDGGYQRILVGTDFSPMADAAIARAVEVAAPGAPIHVLNAWHVPVAAPIDGTDPTIVVRADLAEDAKVRAGELVKRWRATGVAIEMETSEAPAADALIDRAESLGAELIVVGSHGHRGVRRLVLGSVAEATVRHAPCSVLVAR
ncbi:MAG TPA: universal stress protein [Kofleriaceae bacterium]|nr:universal stress protein [Kofleriaceae bacterium]